MYFPSFLIGAAHFAAVCSHIAVVTCSPIDPTNISARLSLAKREDIPYTPFNEFFIDLNYGDQFTGGNQTVPDEGEGDNGASNEGSNDEVTPPPSAPVSSETSSSEAPSMPAPAVPQASAADIVSPPAESLTTDAPASGASKDQNSLVSDTHTTSSTSETSNTSSESTSSDPVDSQWLNGSEPVSASASEHSSASIVPLMDPKASGFPVSSSWSSYDDSTTTTTTTTTTTVTRSRTGTTEKPIVQVTESPVEEVVSAQTTEPKTEPTPNPNPAQGPWNNGTTTEYTSITETRTRTKHLTSTSCEEGVSCVTNSAKSEPLLPVAQQDEIAVETQAPETEAKAVETKATEPVPSTPSKAEPVPSTSSKAEPVPSTSTKAEQVPCTKTITPIPTKAPKTSSAKSTYESTVVMTTCSTKSIENKAPEIRTVHGSNTTHLITPPQTPVYEAGASALTLDLSLAVLLAALLVGVF